MASIQFLTLLAILILSDICITSRYNAIHQPCTALNLMCTCTTAGLSLGSVTCKGVPVRGFLSKLKYTKIHELTLHTNRMEDLGENNFYGTGLWRIEIRNNYLIDLAEKTFYGVEHSLQELDLSNNKFQKIPRKAIQFLTKLKVLNISGNYLTSVYRADFQPMRQMLNVLNLAYNALSKISEDTFWDLMNLKILNLCGNNLNELPEKVFHSELMIISEIVLCKNLLKKIPFLAIKNLKNLHILNLNENRISTFESEDVYLNTLSLDKLLLDKNLIYRLQPHSFKNFNQIIKLSLRGNPLEIIEDYAFENVIIKEIHMQSCNLSQISEKAFSGIENTLELLELDFNNLVIFPFNIFSNFYHLKTISFRGNNNLDLPSQLVLSNSSIQNINLLGTLLNIRAYETMKSFPNLRSCTLTIPENKFDLTLLNFSSAVEELNIHNGLNALESLTFHKLPRLKKLNLSGNKIHRLQESMFKEIGQSLEILNLANALSKKYLSKKSFLHLEKLKSLDLSYNFIHLLPEEIFHPLRALQHLYLHDNNLEFLPPEIFQPIASANLETLSLSFNKLKKIPPTLFKGLQNLKYLYLDNNFIENIDSFTFVDLKKLDYLTLEGNELGYLDTNAFQNLPQLNNLNIAFNKLKEFNLQAFDQVGSLGNLNVDLRFNSLEKLFTNTSISENIVNIRTIHFKSNKIVEMNGYYFYPICNSLTHIYLQDNQLNDLNETIFESIPYLQEVDLRKNNITTIDENIFSNLFNLQILNLAYNHLTYLPASLLLQLHFLRVFDISHNHLTELEPDIFYNTPLEQMHLSHNNLIKIPAYVFNTTARHLYFLDISHNQISYLDSDLSHVLPFLLNLNISNNLISIISPESIINFKFLISLDMSNNPLIQSSKWLSAIPKQLRNLNIANTCLSEIPAVNLPNLQFLNLSSNSVTEILAEKFTNSTLIQILDMSNNYIHELPSAIWTQLPLLIKLSLANNVFQTVANESFFGMEYLQELDLRNVTSLNFQPGALGHIQSLKKLLINSNYDKNKFNLSSLIEKNLGIQYLHIQMNVGSLSTQLHGKLPHHLNHIVITGKQLNDIHSEAFTGLNSNKLKLTIQETSLTTISEDIFKNMKNIHYLNLDIQSNLLQAIEFPVSSKNGFPDGFKLMLSELKLANNFWICECSSIGWLENWMRNQRKSECFSNPENSKKKLCRDLNQAIRDATCFDKKNKSLIDALKSDLECNTSNSETSTFKIKETIIMLAIIIQFAYTLSQ